MNCFPRALLLRPLQQCPVAPSQQVRTIRNAAKRIKSKLDSERPLPLPKISRNLPKRDETVYGVPRVPIDRRGLEMPQNPSEYGSHPLWAFFHGQQSIELPDYVADNVDRAWSAAELRRKSFVDLQKLWYILLKERNVLYTQKEEMRINNVQYQATYVQQKIFRCKKSMARIKYVVSERRRAAIEAGQILASQQDERTTPDFTEQELALPPLPPHPPVKAVTRRQSISV